ncbi:hypothetical protein J19TS2_30780 [Cohnella xylanilytica]|uniref:Ger(x)C family spore germination protein n=1 Tax=Cohnella xylanilytica TaxID=557555 RepID=UPI001B27B12E|nr:Ger(x)C family spore germination protein [Cohnella xylanilytica]GIO13523.1 hypothetical protein J19TS2_30780 [Cohnella xylanilytica]
MRRTAFKLALSLIAAVCLAGCYDKVDMEDVSFSLVVGIDANEENGIRTFTTIPVFSKNAKKKTQELKVEARTLRESRDKFDAFSIGSFNGRKAQVIVFSKRLVQQVPDWFRYVDVFFRDGRNPITPKLVMFDGDLEQLFRYQSPDQPMLPLMLIGMIESASSRSESVKTTLQELHRQMYDPGQTPYLAEMSIEQDAKMKGTALLDRKGKYAATLSLRETTYLRMLQKTSGPAVNLTLPLPSSLTKAPPDKSWISLVTERVRTRIKPSYSGGRFRFDVRIRISASVIEKLSHIDLDKLQKQVEAACAREIRGKFEELIDKFQASAVDPVGFGIYARAYEYAAFRGVKDDWGKAFSEADIRVKVLVSFADEGSVK